MMDTLTQIQALANERHQLYRRAGQQTLTPSEINRIHKITADLYELWDTHRREVTSQQPSQQHPNKIINFRQAA